MMVHAIVAFYETPAVDVESHIAVPARLRMHYGLYAAFCALMLLPHQSYPGVWLSHEAERLYEPQCRWDILLICQQAVHGTCACRTSVSTCQERTNEKNLNCMPHLKCPAVSTFVAESQTLLHHHLPRYLRVHWKALLRQQCCG